MATVYDQVTSQEPPANSVTKEALSPPTATADNVEKRDIVPPSTQPQSTTDLEKKPTLPPTRDLEGATQTGSQDPLELLKKIQTDDDAHPIRWALWKKWVIIAVYCSLQVFVTLTSTTYVSVEFLIQEKWGGSTQVITLGQSMFIVGTAVGPAFLGMQS